MCLCVVCGFLCDVVWFIAVRLFCLSVCARVFNVLCCVYDLLRYVVRFVVCMVFVLFCVFCVFVSDVFNVLACCDCDLLCGVA